MCLLIVMSRLMPDAPLMVAANRDERLDRPSVTMTVLRQSAPRILGGRDELAGGTWLAVNQHGVVAGLTNRPSPDGRDPAKRSRGELPLKFAMYRSAAAAVSVLSAEIDPGSYNPCWLLVGDRESLFFVDVSGESAVETQELGPGLYVLENSPLRSESAKAEFVRGLVTAALPEPGPHQTSLAMAALAGVLRDHQPAAPEPRTDSTGRSWPASLSAACVHGDGYGTRSAMIVSVPAAASGEVPTVLAADGPPCQASMADATGLWSQPDVASSG